MAEMVDWGKISMTATGRVAMQGLLYRMESRENYCPTVIYGGVLLSIPMRTTNQDANPDRGRTTRSKALSCPWTWLCTPQNAYNAVIKVQMGVSITLNCAFMKTIVIICTKMARSRRVFGRPVSPLRSQECFANDRERWQTYKLYNRSGSQKFSS